MSNQAEQDKYLRTKGFTVQIDSLDSKDGKADSSWSRCSGGAEMIETIESTTGKDASQLKYNTFTPGHSYVTPIVLEGYMTPTREDMIKWIDAQMNGEKFRRVLTITPLKVDGSAATAHEYHECFVEEYTFPDLDASVHDTLMEKITIRSLYHKVGGK